MAETPVALRSESARLIEEVRTILAVAGLPVAVYPEHASPPADVGLALDAAEQPDDAWRTVGSRSVRVALEGDDDGALVLPAAADRLLALARAANRRMRARVVGVVGARGGIGSSALAAALARVSASRALTSALVDGADGAPLEVLLGLEDDQGLRWPDLTGAGSIDPVELAGALPVWEGTRVLCADQRPAALTANADGVIVALAQVHDAVVLDLPRHAVAAGVAAHWCDVVLILTTPDAASAAGARRVAALLRGQDARLVVRGPIRDGYTPSELAQFCGVPLAGAMRPERSLPLAMDRGLPPGEASRGPLMRLARQLVTDLGVGE